MPYNPRTGEFLVNTSPAGNQTQPAVTRLSDGRYLVVWQTPTTEANSQFYIRGQFYAADGSKIGAEMGLTPLMIRSQSGLAATARPNGGFALSWVQHGSSSATVNYRTFDSSGNITNTLTLDQGLETSLATLANGSTVLVYSKVMFVGGIPTPVDIGGYIIPPGGPAVQFVDPASQGRSEASVSVLSGGNIVVTWTNGDPATGDGDGGAIKGRIYSSAGAELGGEFLVNSTAAGWQTASEVEALPGGGFVVVWVDASAAAGDTSGTAIRGQVFDGAGNKVGTEFLVNTSTANDQMSPKLLVASAGWV